MKPFFLTEDFDRVRRLSGLPPLTETEKLEKLLYEVELDLYCLQNNVDRNLLTEGVIQTVTNRVKELSKNPEKLKQYLKDVIKKIAPSTYSKVDDYIRDYKGPKKVDDVVEYLNNFLSIKDIGKSTFKRLKRSIIIGATALLMIATLTGNVGANDIGSAFSTQQTAITQTINQEQNSTFIQHERGEHSKELSQDEKNELKELLKKADGKTIEVTILISSEGKEGGTENVSNKTGEYDLNDWRKKTAEQDLEKIAEELGLNIKFIFETEFSEKQDERGYKVEIENEKSSEFPNPADTGDTDGTVGQDSNNTSTGDAFGGKTPPTLGANNKIQQLIYAYLPYLTGNKQPSRDVQDSLQQLIGRGAASKGKFEKALSDLKRKGLREQENLPALDETIKILEWAVGTVKNPKVLADNFKKLDPNVDIRWKKRVLMTPGKAGRSVGSGPDDVGQKEPQNSPPEDSNIYTLKENYLKLINILINENILLEASTDFNAIPDFDAAAAKKNIGMLVLMLSHTWPIISYEGGKQAIDYVKKQDPDLVDRFKKTFKVETSDTVGDFKYYGDEGDDKGGQKTDNPNDKTGGDGSTDKEGEDVTKTVTTTDKQTNEKPTLPDVERAIKDLHSNKRLVESLQNIDLIDELYDLMKDFFDRIRFEKGKVNSGKIEIDNKTIRRSLVLMKNRFIPRDKKTGRFTKIQEDETAHSKRVDDILGTFNRLEFALDKVDTAEEITQFFLRGVFPLVNSRVMDNTAEVFQVLKKLNEYFKDDKTSDVGGSVDKDIKVLDENIIGKKEKFLLKNLYK